MSFPSEKELKKMRKLLDKAEPSRPLPKNATAVQEIKYKLCRKFVAYLLENDLSQAELARRINLDPARIGEIVKYKTHLFTVDNIDCAERLESKIFFEVA